MTFLGEIPFRDTYAGDKVEWNGKLWTVRLVQNDHGKSVRRLFAVSGMSTATPDALAVVVVRDRRGS